MDRAACSTERCFLPALGLLFPCLEVLQGAGAVSATLAALLADRTRPEVRTRSMAVFGIGIGASFLLALMFGPIIASATGVRSLFWLAAILAAIAASLLLLRCTRHIPS